MIKKAIIAGLLSAITITSVFAADNSLALAADGGFNVEVPTLKAILPPPPKPGSLVYQNDMDVSHASFFVKDAKRYKLAIAEADESVNGFANTFEQAFGHPISQQATPVAWKLINQLIVTHEKFTDPIKHYYHRIRPFAYFHEKACSPSSHINTSYPSGHTTTGWLIALSLSQINPARATQIMQKGYEYGQSRIVCGSHWPSDVKAGYLAGSIVFSQVQDNPLYQQEVQQAKQEIAQK